MAGQGKYTLQVISYPEGDTPTPYPRSGHRMVSHGRDIYVWGGMNTNVPENHPFYVINQVWARTNPCFQEMWKYSYLTHRWQLLETHGQIPEHLVGHGMCIIGDIIYVFGGTKIPYGEDNSNQLYSFHINTRVWTRLPYNQMAKYPLDDMEEVEDDDEPDPLYGQAVTGKHAVSIEFDQQFDASIIYVFGGAFGSIPPQYDNNVFEYNMRTTKWGLLFSEPVDFEIWQDIWDANLPHPVHRYRAELALHDDLIYVLGGGNHFLVAPFEQIDGYNFTTRKWSVFETLPDNAVNINNGYPQGRRAFACAQYGHDVYISGGTNSSVIFDDIWKLDLATLRWTFICRMPTPLQFHASSLSADGVLSIFGGSLDHYSTVRTGDLLCMHFQVQTLQDLAFVSASHYGFHKELDQLKALFPEKFE